MWWWYWLILTFSQYITCFSNMDDQHSQIKESQISFIWHFSYAWGSTKFLIKAKNSKKITVSAYAEQTTTINNIMMQKQHKTSVLEKKKQPSPVNSFSPSQTHLSNLFPCFVLDQLQVEDWAQSLKTQPLFCYNNFRQNIIINKLSSHLIPGEPSWCSILSGHLVPFL